MDIRQNRILRGIHTTQAGLLVNAVLVIVKIVTGTLGHSYALVADGIESSTDVFSSLIVWRGLKLAGRSADEEFQYGYGKAETLAAAVVALLLLGAALTITIQAIREILTPHHIPEPFTLIVLAIVIVIKELLFRKVGAVAEDVQSRAVETDAWHHRSDAITSGAAFVGISMALLGGEAWAPADDWAALVAAVMIGVNGIRLLRPAAADLMDRAPEPKVLNRIKLVADQVPGVLATEKLRARKAGLDYYVDIHVQADPKLSLFDAHELGHEVKFQIMGTVPEVADVIIHMEPFIEGYNDAHRTPDTHPEQGV